MKVIIPENRVEQIIFKYLDVKFKDLEQSKEMYYDIFLNFQIKTLEYWGGKNLTYYTFIMS